ncbi:MULTISPECIES: sensor histidine kinase [Brevibacillus]|uniref:histidine kinase n=1 Tax=Brevibacillus parabrevis TaxID=54914 RepID=A0A4Y3PL37_BREPA|nr:MULTISPECIES: ATP-binding protein [Brevibacillus]MBU8714198.1 histidine kinase [Brevibacillus parabrevis]MDH6350345.1 two-component system NtrC family sensor kinase [Brevibacillus sp. 1238]MED2253420.1 histidine kinase dimerization/phospho-acceptor domain-containing protein [Brevibacillus parabrevis]NRQ55787.1 histidine kinase [Brevibacillus sp. HD1.4A]RNB95107.1 histidine kinase [Brevibacillus parabrevis]
MQSKQEILEKLTGISSSRKSYYSELVYLVEEMKKKNRQLAVINQLTHIQIDATWQQTSSYIAQQLSQILAFEHFTLTIVKGGTPTSYLCMRTDTDWQCHTLTHPHCPDTANFPEQLHHKLAQTLPQHYATSVSLRNPLNQTFGYLTLLREEQRPADPEEAELIQLVARHVGVIVENSLLFQDVNEKIKIEAQLIQSAKMAAIGEMAAGIAHELNSPLTAILGNSQLLLRETADAPTAPLMRDIYQCGVRCKKIIQNLLTFSRQEEYLFETVSIDEVVEDVLGLIGYQLSVCGLTITREMNEPSLLFHGSRHQIEQVVINLLLNARDALSEQEAPRILIRSFPVEEDGVRYAGLSVYDNGTGIPAEQLSQIFQPFFSTKERTKGTGLGLSVSLGIAEAHGGKLYAQSEENRYSEFTLLLPLLIKEEEHQHHGAETDIDCG